MKRYLYIFFIFFLFLFSSNDKLQALSKENLLVVYMAQVPESADLAEYYRVNRGLNPEQLLGVTPESGSSYTNYKNTIEIPVINKIAFLQTNYNYSIQAIVICKPVPLYAVNTDGTTSWNASVDSELAAARTPNGSGGNGYLINPYYYARVTLQPFVSANYLNMLLVTRLDGPTYDLAKGLVDKALRAEQNGVAGNGYFDQFAGYSLDEEPNKSIGKAYNLFKAAGFKSQIDSTSGLLLPPVCTGENALFYCGWYDYDHNYLTNGAHYQWQDGSIGIHLWSGGADVLDLRYTNWCPHMINAGITATQGSVDEGYTIAYSNAYYLLLYMLNGLSYAEACYASNVTLSWKQVFIGDPLLRWPTSSLPSPPISSIIPDENGHIKIQWNTIYGRSYAVEYSDGNSEGNLTPDAIFIPVNRSLVREGMNPGNGESFTDDFTDPPSPPNGKRYYEIKIIN